MAFVMNVSYLEVSELVLLPFLRLTHFLRLKSHLCYFLLLVASAYRLSCLVRESALKIGAHSGHL